MSFLNKKALSLPSVPKIPNLPVPSPSLPSLPASKSITSIVDDTRAKVVRSMSMLSDKDDEKQDDAEPPVLEPVYIVLRPLNLTDAPQALLKGVGHVVKDLEFENYLMFQHWGVLIGERYYHLHINDKTNKISVSMVPFVDVNKHQRHTIKIPIWRTHLAHDERVGVAVGIIKTMGNYGSEAEVEITDEEGKLVTSPEDRERYRMEGRYLKSPLAALSIFKGEYNALANNCIHFTRHYIFDQILTRKKELRNLSTNIQWVVAKWQDMGCRRSPIELAKFLTGIFCINPFSMTPNKGARLLIKLLSVYLNIEYNPTLDKKLLDDSTEADEALEALSDAPITGDVEPTKAASSELSGEGEESMNLEQKMGVLQIAKE
ncbi:hypothetical protein MVEN_00281500 [Mycena venus]|uniref:PPPDE domain-containing protein n=1 Tax=Mycena venus TaxID=2733690 RepID=A0A8H6Z2L2_9AGAR|nr:hypothetical protein MVEN_00281500 [Mycena venus]